jgi:hypothetical protein
MSATVETDYVYVGTCSDCLTTSRPCEDEAEAEEWAANHNAENHAEDDGSDDADTHRKDSRHE